MTGDRKNKSFEEIIKSESEVGCYLAMRSIGYMMWKLNHDAADGRIEDGPHIDESLRVFADDQKLVAKRIAELTGITVLTKNGKNVTPAYTNWYDRWSKYIESLPEETFNDIRNKINSDKDTTDITLPEE